MADIDLDRLFRALTNDAPDIDVFALSFSGLGTSLSIFPRPIARRLSDISNQDLSDSEAVGVLLALADFLANRNGEGESDA